MIINSLQDTLTRLANSEDIPADEARQAFQIIMNGGATPGQMGAFLMGLRAKGETVDELTAGAEVLRAKCTAFTAPEHAIDTCGTGGDLKHTLNISTAAAIVTAACGLPVAKHGNRAISSASGSSDILSALDINVMAEPAVMERALAECNLCFLMAPKYHAAMRHIAPVRLELGLRTIFNLLGPLANPAKVRRQLLGVWDRKWLVPLAHTLHRLGSIRAWVVCGADGMDEITVTDVTHIAELNGGKVREFTLSPEDYGIERADMASLKGQDAEYNAAALRRMLGGEKSAYRDAVLLNAAAALVIGERAAELREGLALAATAVDQGNAAATLEHLSRLSREV